MELNQLRCFRLVAELENISRAAKLLHISQPSLSQTIRRLEQEMGYPLFHREGRKIELNRSGEILMDAVARMEQILAEAKLAIEEENGARHPVVSLYMGCASMLLPDLLRFLKGRNPGVQYVIHQLKQEIAGKEADIRIIAEKEGSDDQLLLTERICLALPVNHPLARKKHLYLRDLQQEEFISLNQDWTLPELIGEAMDHRHFKPNITMWVDNPNLMRELLRDHMGIAFVPEISWQDFAGEDVVIRPVEDCFMERGIYLALAGSGGAVSREQRECVEGIREFFRMRIERENKKEDLVMLQMSMVFGDGMVLQRQKEIAVWGTLSAGTAGVAGMTVRVTLASTQGPAGAGAYGSQTVETTAAEDGSWKVALPAGEAERGLTMTVEAGGDRLVYTDVCIGEVWIAGGQSNMEYFMKHDADKAAELAKAANPDIRFFDYPEVSYETQWEEFPDEEYGFWRKADPENLPMFSAVGYYFAAVLQQKLDIPVGIVGCNWGGTPACAWQDPAYLAGTEGEVWLTEYEEAVKDLDIPSYEKMIRESLEKTRAMKNSDNPMAAGMDRILYPGFTWEEQVQMQEMMAANADAAAMVQPPMGPMHQNRPGGLYETMLKKVAPFTAKGVIWYQGESDELHADMYAKVFGSMIRCWRDLWQEELPFLFVQLAPFWKWLGCVGDNYPELRHQQELVSKTVPQTWMASIGDAGMEYDIHPKHKKPVGERLAELALGHVYEQPDLCRVPGLCDAPELAAAERRTTESGAEEIRIRFHHGSGLHLEKHGYTSIEPEQEDSMAEVADGAEVAAGTGIPEMTWTEGEVELEQDEIAAIRLVDTATGQELTGWSAELLPEEDSLILTGAFPEKVEVLFAWEPYYEVNLYNEAGIPVKPFRVTV